MRQLTFVGLLPFPPKLLASKKQRPKVPAGFDMGSYPLKFDTGCGMVMPEGFDLEEYVLERVNGESRSTHCPLS